MSYLCVNVLVVESLNGLVDCCFSREEQGSAVLMSSAKPPPIRILDQCGRPDR